MNASGQALNQLTVGGFRWLLLPTLQKQLLGNDGLRLPEWLASGQARIVKQGPNRLVYRVELPGLRFYVKHNLISDQRAWIRQLMRPSKARIEYDLAIAAADRGIPTIAPIALAEQETLAGMGESILITQSLDDCVSLHTFLAAVLPTYAEPRATLLRHQLAVELGRLVARIHDAGVLHHDLHAANLLVRITANDEVQLFVIDLLAVKIGPPLDWERSRDNLVMINGGLIQRVNRADRLRFWKAYHQTRHLGPWKRDGYGTKLYFLEVREIEEMSWQRNLRFWLRRDKRCLEDCKYYRRVNGAGVVGHAVMEVADADVAALLRDPDAPFRQPGVRVLKESVSSTVVEMAFPINGQLRPVIYKRFRVTSWKDPLASLVRPTPALRSWIQGQGFRERGLPTARPFLVLHRRSFGMLHEGYLLTEKIDHAADLHDYMGRLDAIPRPRRLTIVRQLIEWVARAIRSLHQRNLSHRDLKAANILARLWNASPDEPSAYSQDIQNLLYMPEGSVWLIDLVGVESFAKLTRARRVQNLARLSASFHECAGVTRTDRLRFLLTYLQSGVVGGIGWKGWWREIDKATWKKVRRNLRLGKPLQ